MLNIAAIMGRLTADPELKHTQNSLAFVRFSVAVDRSYAKAGTERQTDFIDVVAWRGTAEFVSKYFRKGQMIAVNGAIQTGSYTDSNGVKRRTFEIVADNVSFTESKRDSSSTGSTNTQSSSAYNEPAAAFSSGSNQDFEEIIGDDDLPF